MELLAFLTDFVIDLRLASDPSKANPTALVTIGEEELATPL